MQLTLGPYVVHIWSRNTQEIDPNGTVILPRVVRKTSGNEEGVMRRASLITPPPHPQDRHRALGMVLL